MLFTDGSVNTLSKIGYGAYLALEGHEFSQDSLGRLVKVKRFEPTSSTKLELQTLLWALTDIQASGRKVIVFTDSQNIISLPGRRLLLEQNEYRSKSKKLIANYSIYQEFYRITDQLDFELIKMTGHQASDKKEHYDSLFTLVDRASRKALREDKH
jgi:ribonuclease HI